MTEAFLETMIAGVAAAAAAAASRLAEAGLPVEIARFDVDAGVEVRIFSLFENRESVRNENPWIGLLHRQLDVADLAKAADSPDRFTRARPERRFEAPRYFAHEVDTPGCRGVGGVLQDREGNLEFCHPAILVSHGCGPPLGIPAIVHGAAVVGDAPILLGRQCVGLKIIGRTFVAKRVDGDKHGIIPAQPAIASGCCRRDTRRFRVKSFEGNVQRRFRLRNANDSSIRRFLTKVRDELYEGLINNRRAGPLGGVDPAIDHRWLLYACKIQ